MQRHASKNQKFHSPFFLILGIILLTSFSAGGAEKRRPFEKWAYLGDPVRGGEWRHATTVDPGLLNPNHWPVNNWDVIDSIYDSYFGAAEQQLPTPFLAESWNLINPLTFDIKLRKGIVFHDGSPLNAASLKYHLEWIKNRQNGCWNRVYLDPIKSIELIAENTARLHFHLPFATVTSFLSYVPGFAVSMKALKNDMALREKERLSRKARTLRKKLVKAEKKASKARSGGDDKSGKAARKAAKLKKVLAEVETRLEKIQAETQGVAKTDIHPVGSAAYMFDDRAPGNWLRVKRNPDYWYGKTVGYPDMPYFDAIKWIVIPDKAIQLANLKVGKIHFMALDYSQYDMLKKSPHPAVRITKVNRPQVTSLWFNHARGPCRDIRVRKAISHALDRKALIKGVMFGLAEPATCVLPDALWGRNPELKPVRYDPELSRKLLAEAGYGDGVKLRGHMGTTSVPLAEAVKHMLAAAGIDWKVDILDSAAASDRARNLEFDIAAGGWYTMYDPDNVLSGTYHPNGGFNYGRTRNEAAIKLIEAGRQEYDLAKREKIYWEIEQLLYDNYEDAWLWYARRPRAWHSSVTGYDDSMYNKYGDAWKDTHFYQFTHFKKGHR